MSIPLDRALVPRRRCNIVPTFVVDEAPLNTKPLYKKVAVGGMLDDPLLEFPIWINELALRALKRFRYDPLDMKIEIVESKENPNLVTYRCVTDVDLKE